VRIDGLKLLFLAGATVLAVASAACGDFIRQDRAAVTLVIDRLEAASGQSTTFGGTLQSDVLTNGGIISDSGRVTMRLIPKDVGTTPSATNGVTITRYRVTFRRTDGRNTPGVDVPQPFDSAVTFTVPVSGNVTHPFELIRHVAKQEAPLGALAQSIGLIVSTVADVTFYGHDQAGNELSVTGNIGIQFGNFADPEN
jgi:hypothetical protein